MENDLRKGSGGTGHDGVRAECLDEGRGFSGLLRPWIWVRGRVGYAGACVWRVAGLVFRLTVDCTVLSSHGEIPWSWMSYDAVTKARERKAK